jgi:predicted transposase YbfD/YdcC
MAQRRPNAVCEVTVPIESIIHDFEAMPDPRHHRNRRHLLVDVITISVCGVIVGCDGPTAIEDWAKAREKWLQQFLELPNGIPSRDCIRRVLTAVKPEAFPQCFESWIAGLICEGARPLRLIAVDGKTLRRSHDANRGLGPLHMVSAWASENGLSLGQIATDQKSNEITAIPELIDRIDVKGALVTIDALGCPKDIARKIVDAKGDYVLAVKDNQPKLHQAIKEFFSDERPGELAKSAHRKHQTSEQSHGRQEQRYYVLAKLPRDFPQKDQWPGIAAIGMAVRVTEKADGATSGDVRYFISSCYLSGRRFAEAVRGHWSIENSLHWVLDVSFREDQSRTRHRRMADNLAWLRRFAVSLLKRHPSKHSVIGKSRIAGWNNEFLLEVLTAQGA